jgi:hypothetical protein
MGRVPSLVLTLTILWLSVACQPRALPTPDEPLSSTPSLEVLEIVTSRGIGGDYVPIDITSQFSPTDTFYCAVRVAGAERNAEIVARWYFGDALISETPYATETTGTGYVAFELTNQQPWPEGLYRVEVLSAGVVMRAVEFRVAK